MKNNRTFLEKLLDGAEVEWKPLKDILIRTKGTKITAAEMKILHKDNAPLKIFAGGKTFALVNFEDIPEKDINKNPSIIVKSRGIIEFEYYDKPFSHKNEMWSYYSNDKNINIKYIYYVLKNQEPYFQNLGSKMQMPQIATPDTDKYLVPIPPLPVQTEIVKILDALTALTSELTSELILRRKQYEYYRERLLSFDSLERLNMGGAKKKLIDVAYFQNGKGHEKNIDENGSFIVINSKFISTNGAVKKYCNDQLVPLFKEDILIVMSDLPNGKALAKTFFVTEDNKYTLNQRIGRITVKEEVELLPSFVNHFLNRNKQLTKYDNGTDQTNLRKDQILDVVIPILPLKEQQRIVSILDKFETLTNSITEGLPLAIEQSQKRYEYYRELLLNFS